ncbi:hypothetical protein [Lactobacillus terrae]|uniref:hypothetical protein n=1 Tax=Lactobacillus terrae TaxID=2269374 RepID=UPI0010FEF074|nr:hypothetical protein [Lactobacillus terrae]
MNKLAERIKHTLSYYYDLKFDHLLLVNNTLEDVSTIFLECSGNTSLILFEHSPMNWEAMHKLIKESAEELHINSYLVRNVVGEEPKKVILNKKTP